MSFKPYFTIKVTASNSSHQLLKNFTFDVILKDSDYLPVTTRQILMMNTEDQTEVSKEINKIEDLFVEKVNKALGCKDRFDYSIEELNNEEFEKMLSVAKNYWKSATLYSRTGEESAIEYTLEVEV